ncbi:MAG: Gfo/Idh/MocA family oxidoreductase [Gemmataceae bacterium]|jgi:predicted dehydrogenase|nr:Gfo/Idh/MocA family oxidoreductase [Gemmataceae bacterium]
MSEQTTRRDFLTTTAAAGAALSLTGGVFGGTSEAVKVGIVGCGGRGSGAAENILDADPQVKIVSFGDAFEFRAKELLKRLKGNAKYKDRILATEDSTFSGLDAYKKVIASDCDVVVLATPPGFRPLHLEEAVKAGKHIFTEKPVAVDVAGIKKVLALVEETKKKKLGVVAGTQRRHQAPYLEIMKRVHNGDIGEILSARAYWNGNAIWFRPRTELAALKIPDTDLNYQLHNWYHFLWMCGDHIVEQHIHNLDVVNWAMKDQHPIKATGMGGRTIRPSTNPEVNGHIFDHFAVEFEYKNGLILQSYCRQINGCASSISEALVGTKGKVRTDDGSKVFLFNGEPVEAKGRNPYVQEHIDLIKSIKDGKPLNELEAVTNSTMTAILGRMSTYTGKTLNWDDVMKNMVQDTFPKEFPADGKLPVSPVPVPGSYKI